MEHKAIDSTPVKRAESGAARPSGPSDDRTQAGTRERLMQAAGRLFAETSFHAVSVRNIVAVADVNLGAINYHFGSKQALFEAVFADRASRIVEMRLDLLERCQTGSGRPPLLEQILTAYLAPGLAVGKEQTDLAEFQRIRARLVTEDSDLALKLLRRHFRDSTMRFLDRLSEALPDTPRDLLRWRFQALIATIVYSSSNWGMVHSLSDEDDGSTDGMQSLAYLVPMMAALFRTRTEDQPSDIKQVLDAITTSGT